MRFIVYIFIASFVISSCDYVENPIPVSTGDFDWSLYPYDTASTPYPYDLNNPESNWTANTNTERNVLLEDYTGHKCSNCPAGADTVHALEVAYPDRLIVATIHAGDADAFQYLQPPTFIIDFTTQAGDVYIVEMEEFLGNPAATVNRQANSVIPGLVWHPIFNWRSAVANEIATAPLQCNLQLKHNYYPETNGLFIHTETEFKDNLTGDYNLIIYLIRDTVVAPQQFGNSIVDTNYNHHAVLSNNINGTWGTSIATGSVSSGDVFYNDFSYQLPDPSLDNTYNIDNLSLITYLCDRNSFEVIQVIKTKLSP